MTVEGRGNIRGNADLAGPSPRGIGVGRAEDVPEQMEEAQPADEGPRLGVAADMGLAFGRVEGGQVQLDIHAIRVTGRPAEIIRGFPDDAG